jgi:hypothetical protein
MDTHNEQPEEEVPESDMDLNLDYMISLKIYLESEYNIPPNSHSMIIRHLFTFLKEFKFTNGDIKTAITLLYENQFPDKINDMHYIINRLLSQESFSSNLSNLFSSLSNQLTMDNNDQNDDILDRYTGNIINPANILYYFTDNVNNINPVVYNSHINNIPMFNLFTLDPSHIFNFTTQMIMEDITPITNNGKETLDQASLNSVSLTDTFSNLDDEIKKKFDTCPICFDDFKSENVVRKIKCNHIFHQSCIDPWLLNESYKCPVCRESTLPEQIPNQPQSI